MTTTTATAMLTPPRRQRWRKLAAALALGTACLLPAQQARAFLGFGDIVNDPTFMLQEAMNWVQELGQWTAQLKNWESMISKLDPQNFMAITLSKYPLSPLTEAQEEEFMTQSCPGPGTAQSILTSIGSLFSGDTLTKGKIADTQQRICMQIKKLEVRKYNNAVNMMNQINGYSGKIGELEGILNNIESTITAATTVFTDIKGLITGVDSTDISGNGLGNLMGQMNLMQKNMAGLSAEMSNYKTAIDADDAMIHTLEQMQSNLAKVALGTRPTTGGKIIQSAAFLAAFSD